METAVEQPLVKVRAPRRDKGIKRGSRQTAVASSPFLAAPEPEAPVHVRIRLKNYPEAVEFGCAEHAVENGFHVFMYPSERDRYRTTRREFAISEIIEIEITAARHQVERSLPPQYDFPVERVSVEPEERAIVPRGPVIHSARKSATSTIEKLETSNGPIKMESLPGLTFGGHNV